MCLNLSKDCSADAQGRPQSTGPIHFGTFSWHLTIFSISVILLLFTSFYLANKNANIGSHNQSIGHQNHG
jgi:hypothetical protein